MKAKFSTAFSMQIDTFQVSNIFWRSKHSFFPMLENFYAYFICHSKYVNNDFTDQWRFNICMLYNIHQTNTELTNRFFFLSKVTLNNLFFIVCNYVIINFRQYTGSGLESIACYFTAVYFTRIWLQSNAHKRMN